MELSYQRASKAMLVTNLTTFFAFIATIFSTLMPVSAFSCWAAVIVFCDYILVVTVYPSLLIIHELYISEYEKKCLCYLCNRYYLCEISDGNINKFNRVERFFGTKFSGFVIRFRFVFVLLFSVLFGVSVYFAMLIEPKNENDQWFFDSHYMQSVINFENKFYGNDFNDLVYIDVIWGIDGVNRQNTDWYDPSDYGKIKWDDGFDMSMPETQLFMYDMCVNLTNNRNLVYDNDNCNFQNIVDYSISINASFPWTYTNVNNANYSNKTQKEEFAMFLYNFSQSDYGADMVNDDLIFVQLYIDDDDNDSTDNNYQVKAELRYIGLNLPSTVQWDSTLSESLRVRNLWQKWLKNNFYNNPKCPTGVCKPIQASYRWAWLQSRVEFTTTAIQGILIAIPLTFGVLIFSTRSVYVSVFATFTIAGVIVCELGLISLLDWEFGVSESVSAVIMIGFSIDYTVHIGNAYLECKTSKERNKRISYALLTMAISIVSGAVTTVITTSFLLIPPIIFFQKMAILFITTIIFSIAWAMVFFTSLLAIFGPSNDSSINYANICVQKVRNLCSV